MLDMRFIIILLLTFVTFSIHSQDYFLVELEKRTPTVKDLIMSYEGFPMIPIIANDLDYNEHNLMSYKGKPLVLWFWNKECGKCITQMDALNLLQEKYNGKFHLISFADEPREKIKEFTQMYPITFPVIPNSKPLADGPYGGDLGYPRIFVIDEYGVNKWVFPSEEMQGDFNTYGVLNALLDQLLNK